MFDFSLNFCKSDSVWEPQNHKEVKNIFVVYEDLTACYAFTWASTQCLVENGGVQKQSSNKSKLFKEISAACMHKCKPERLT